MYQGMDFGWLSPGRENLTWKFSTITESHSAKANI